MKSLYFIFFFSMFISFCFSQEKEGYENSVEASDGPIRCIPESPSNPKPKPKTDDNAIFEKVNVRAEFTKGNPVSYISQYLEYPDRAIENKIEGRILVKFTVERDGSATNIRVASKKLGYGLDEMAINAVRKTSRLWKPALIEDKPVRSNIILPITFSLPQEDPEPTDTPE